jgi:hypothetical protein
MSKLTLSVDQHVVTRARRYAERQGTSISRLVETYLAAVAGELEDKNTTSPTPVLKLLAGILRGDRRADRAAYRRHLAAKYR